jgi:hypothetical protein
VFILKCADVLTQSSDYQPEADTVNSLSKKMTNLLGTDSKQSDTFKNIIN